MEGYLNELSLPTYSNKQEVKAALIELNKIIKKLKSLGVNAFRTNGNFLNHEFLQGVSLLRLLDNRSVIDPDLKSVLLATFCTLDFKDIKIKYPFIESMKVYENDCEGLGLACEELEDCIAISFPNSDWQNKLYPVSITELTDNDNNELVFETINSDTRNIFSELHCEFYSSFLLKQKERPRSGKELWTIRQSRFPSLDFCNSTKKQIQNLEVPELTQVYSNLLDLEKIANQRIQISTRLFKYKTTPESDSRLNNYKDRLTFLCSDGTERLFSWHSRYTPGDGRIHFFPTVEQKFYIGYIGSKIQ